MERTELYRHYDADGDLLYVGISRDTLVRLAQHKANGAIWVDDVTKTSIECFPCRKEALKAERRAIKAERPLYNKDHNAGGPRIEIDMPRPPSFFVRQQENGKIVGFDDIGNAFRHFVTGDEMFAAGVGALPDCAMTEAEKRGFSIQIGVPE